MLIVELQQNSLMMVITSVCNVLAATLHLMLWLLVLG
jgi:hypothetical protein